MNYDLMKTRLTWLGGCEIKRMRPIFKTEMSIHQSKANLCEKTFGKITRHFEQEIRKMQERVCLRARIPHSILVNNLLILKLKLYFRN